MGTDLPALGCLLPGKGPKSKGQQDFYPHRRGEGCRALPRTRRGALTPSKRCRAGWKAPRHHGPEQALTPAARIPAYPGSTFPLEVTDSTGAGARCSSAFSAAQPQPRVPSSAGPEMEPSPPPRRAEGEPARPAQEAERSQGSFKALLCFKPFNRWPRGVFSAVKSPRGSGTQRAIA